MDNPTLLGLLGLLGLFLLSGFFSAARSALGNVRRQDLRDQAEKGNKQAQLTLTIVEDSTRVINTFEVANILVHFFIAGLAAILILPPASAWIQTVLPSPEVISYLLSYLIVISLFALLAFVLAELLPEVVVHRNIEGWAKALARLAQVTLIILTPLVNVATGLRRSLIAALGGEAETAMVTEERIMTLVDAGEEEGAIELEEKEMIYSIFQLDETLAREIMVPRIDIIALDINTPLEEAREVIIRAGHSRIPVYEDSLDHVRGLLYAKDLLSVWHEDKQSLDLRGLLRPALFVPESKRISDLLRELQNEKVHLAMVIDEYGGTAGLVTIEDIVEEIVGEIIDEYDFAEEALYVEISEEEFVFDARIDLDDFNRLLDVDLPDEMGDTLGGFIYGQLGRIPDSGDTIETGRLQIEVLTVSDKRIGKVRVRRIPPEEINSKPRNGNHHASNGNGR